MLVCLGAGAAEARRPRGSFGPEAWRAEVAGLGLDPDEVVYPFDATPEMIDWARRVTSAAKLTEPQQRLAHLQRAFFEDEIGDFA